jgi:hypothetical protein
VEGVEDMIADVASDPGSENGPLLVVGGENWRWSRLSYGMKSLGGR